MAIIGTPNAVNFTDGLDTLAAGTAAIAYVAYAISAYRQGQSGRKQKPSPKRSRAISKVLKRDGKEAASSRALSRQATQSARRRRAG